MLLWIKYRYCCGLGSLAMFGFVLKWYWRSMDYKKQLKNHERRVTLMSTLRRRGSYRDQKQFNARHKVDIRLDCWLHSPRKESK